jgi:hypothetical protein
MFFFGNPDLCVLNCMKQDNLYEIEQLKIKISKMELKLKKMNQEVRKKEFMNIDFYDKKIKEELEK